jgi:hypothetical protein
MINYLISLTNKFYTDNKYLVEMLAKVEKSNVTLNNEKEIPYVKNTIYKNNELRELSDEIEKMYETKKSSEAKFKNLIQFIDQNFTELKEKKE